MVRLSPGSYVISKNAIQDGISSKASLGATDLRRLLSASDIPAYVPVSREFYYNFGKVNLFLPHDSKAYLSAYLVAHILSDVNLC
jgi:hypothetical protein